MMSSAVQLQAVRRVDLLLLTAEVVSFLEAVVEVVADCLGGLPPGGPPPGGTPPHVGLLPGPPLPVGASPAGLVGSPPAAIVVP